MGNSFSSIGVRLQTVAFGSKAKPAKKVMNSIDLAYAKELKEIKLQKREADLFERIDSQASMENMKTKIQLAIDSMTRK